MKAHNAKKLLRAAVMLGVGVSASSILAQAQTFTTLYSFAGYTSGDGEYPFPRGQMPFDNNGALYGTTAGGGSTQGGTVFQLVPPQTQGGAWTENVLYTFAGGVDGKQPSEGVVFDALGNLYGSTQFGGTGETLCGGGCGTIFELSPPTQLGGQWTHTVLYSFQGGVDGQYPGEVLFGANGKLYGTTNSGGANPGVPCHSNRRITYGCGTVFELSPPSQQGESWTKTVLYTFPQFVGDGGLGSEIAIDSQGNIFGAAGGGTTKYGRVIEFTPPNGSGAWKETVLYNFQGSTKDGGYPSGAVLFGASGVLYGTGTFNGVTNPNGIYSPSGVVYQLTPPQQPGGTWTETVLHSFPAFKTDGTNPDSTLSIDQNGNLYGTTEFGGSNVCGNWGCGAMFKLAPPSGGGWTETILYNLGNSNQNPNSSMVQFHNGLLYGTTTYLGASDLGQVFTLVP